MEELPEVGETGLLDFDDLPGMGEPGPAAEPAARPKVFRPVGRLPMYNLWSQEELRLEGADQNEERIGIIDALEQMEIEMDFPTMRTTAMSDDLRRRVLQAARENRMPGRTMCANLLNEDTTDATFAALKKVWRQWPGIAYDPSFPVDPALMLPPGTATAGIGMRTSTFSYENDDLVWNAPLMVVIADAFDPKDVIQYRFESCNLSEVMAEDRPNWPDYRKADLVSFDDMWLNWRGLEISTLTNHLLQLGHMTEQGSLWWSYRPASQWRAMLYNETNRTQITSSDSFREIVLRTYEERFPWYHGRRERGRGGMPNGPRPCFTIFVVPNSQEFPQLQVLPIAARRGRQSAQGPGDTEEPAAPNDPSADPFDDFIAMPSSGSSRNSEKRRSRRATRSPKEPPKKERKLRRSQRLKK
ncbi:hypothetical protein N7488_007387 [Penicillium malachiteum]|nr:hypothetical protein N7488_007387 [Penicillium malachiteum]